MKNLHDFSENLELRHICGSMDKPVDGCYAGDLLSWVMSHALENNAWLTIMSNVNVVAVASLTEVACVILCEGVMLDEDAEAAAKEKDICIFSTELSVYEMCLLVGRELSK